MKKAGGILAFLAVCVFILMLHFGIPAPHALNRTYTGVVANIRENVGDLSITNLELAPQEAQAVLAAIQSHSYARRFPDGGVISYGSTRTIILSLVYQGEEAEKHDVFMITNAGVITIDNFKHGGGYLFLPRNDQEQRQLFETIYNAIPK